MPKQTNTRTSKRKHKRKRGKVLKVVLSLLAFALAAGGLVTAHFYASTKKSVNNMYKPSGVTSKNKIEKLSSTNCDMRLGILLMGVDNDAEREKTEDVEGKRTDTLIYLAYDGVDKKIEMVSIPRDTWAQIYDGKGKVVDTNKINSSYNNGGEDAAIETVKHYLNLPVDYYATVNFISFKKIIDAVGGISMDVPFDIYSGYAEDNTGDLLIAKGPQTLNGEQALAFSRIRKVDSDIERGKRQQQVIKATIDKTLQLGSIAKYHELLDAVKGNVNTNLTFDNLKVLASGMIDGFSINSNAFEWTAGMQGEQSVVYVNEDSYKDIREKMLTALGLGKDHTEYKTTGSIPFSESDAGTEDSYYEDDSTGTYDQSYTEDYTTADYGTAGDAGATADAGTASDYNSVPEESYAPDPGTAADDGAGTADAGTGSGDAGDDSGGTAAVPDESVAVEN